MELASYSLLPFLVTGLAAKKPDPPHITTGASADIRIYRITLHLKILTHFECFPNGVYTPFAAYLSHFPGFVRPDSTPLHHTL